MLTDNDECIRAYKHVTEKDGRLFRYIVTYFRGCNGIGDLLTRQARNFIYTKLKGKIIINVTLI